MSTVFPLFFFFRRYFSARKDKRGEGRRVTAAVAPAAQRMDRDLEAVIACLPAAVAAALRRTAESYARFDERLGEIRLRAGCQTAVLLDGVTRRLPAVCTAAEVEETLRRLCEGSVYAHADGLADGYLTVRGFRVGIGGRAVFRDGRIVGIADPRSLCVRVPHRVPGAGDTLVSLFRALGGHTGILLYAPPGAGKTTALREAAVVLSSPPDAYRVVLIDPREELYDTRVPPYCQIDALRGYPIGRAVPIATRVLSPDILILDEIGTEEDAAALLPVARAGVALIASAHAESADDLLARPSLRRLLEAGVFGRLAGLSLTPGGRVWETGPVPGIA